MRKVKRNDLVLVLSGKFRNRTGTVREVIADRGKLIVDGVNMQKKHQRPYQASGTMVPGGILEREAPIDASNVKLICKSCNKATRTGVRLREDQVKVRVCKKCNADID